MGKAGSSVMDILHELPESDKQSLALLDRVNSPNPGDSVSITELQDYADEMAIIKEAITYTGTLHRLEVMRAAFNMSDDMYKLFHQLQRMKI
jgi:hypothetical protein